MFGRRVIRLGDPTTHGGVVVSAAEDTYAWGKPIARMGDNVTCPIPGHRGCVIVEGDSSWTINGRHVALEGHLTSCGASLISTLSNVTVEHAGSAADSSASARSSNAASATTSSMAVNAFAGTCDKYDEQPQLVAPPIAGIPYFIETADGRIFSGRVGADGLLPRIGTTSEAEYTVLWGDEALARQVK